MNHRNEDQKARKRENRKRERDVHRAAARKRKAIETRAAAGFGTFGFVDVSKFDAVTICRKVKP